MIDQSLWIAYEQQKKLVFFGWLDHTSYRLITLIVCLWDEVWKSSQSNDSDQYLVLSSLSDESVCDYPPYSTCIYRCQSPYRYIELNRSLLNKAHFYECSTHEHCTPILKRISLLTMWIKKTTCATTTTRTFGYRTVFITRTTLHNGSVRVCGSRFACIKCSVWCVCASKTKTEQCMSLRQ